MSEPHLYVDVDLPPILGVSEDDIDTMARTVYGEARGEGFVGEVAVAWVIRNRMERSPKYGRNIKAVCLKPLAFSCWLPSDPNLRMLQAVALPSPSFLRCRGVASLVLTGDIQDPTNMATHYLNPLGMPELPLWAQKLPVVSHIGAHIFYRED